jgi:hypothetical protein
MLGMRASTVQRAVLCGAAAVGSLFGVVGGHSWVWPVLFLVGAGTVGVLVGRRPWLVAGLMVSTGALLAAPTEVVGYLATAWMWVVALVGAAALVRCVPDGPTVLWRLALLLPLAERESWRAELTSVLHACGSDTEARRQMIGYLTAMPATLVASWRYRP